MQSQLKRSQFVAFQDDQTSLFQQKTLLKLSTNKCRKEISTNFGQNFPKSQNRTGKSKATAMEICLKSVQ